MAQHMGLHTGSDRIQEESTFLWWMKTSKARHTATAVMPCSLDSMEHTDRSMLRRRLELKTREPATGRMGTHHQ